MDNNLLEEFENDIEEALDSLEYDLPYEINSYFTTDPYSGDEVGVVEVEFDYEEIGKTTKSFAPYGEMTTNGRELGVGPHGSCGLMRPQRPRHDQDRHSRHRSQKLGPQTRAHQPAIYDEPFGGY